MQCLPMLLYRTGAEEIVLPIKQAMDWVLDIRQKDRHLNLVTEREQLQTI